MNFKIPPKVKTGKDLFYFITNNLDAAITEEIKDFTDEQVKKIDSISISERHGESIWRTMKLNYK